ncbi:unnamed protein product [Merluccius merluccius]
MGLKDHAAGTHAGLIHDLGLDLEYLHVEGADRQTGRAETGPPAMEEPGESSDAPPGSPSPTPAEPEGSDAELDAAAAAAAAAASGSTRAAAKPDEGAEGASAHAKNAHQPLCRAQCVDLGTEGPPEPPSERPPPPGEPPKAEPASQADGGRASGGKEYQAKLDFSLKLGYAEETVRLVLSKLGPDTLINDILGELVKLGSKSDGEPPPPPPTGPAAAASAAAASASSSLSSSSSSYGCCDSLEGQRSDSPCPAESPGDHDNLRPIVVDGSNVAMSHGNKEVFSCHGIQLAVDWFLERGHHDITVFVPAWRKEQSRPDAPITDQDILRRLEKEKILVFTPSRRVQGRRVVCYDDRFIVKLAYESDGVIVSNDNYRDLANEKPEWKKFIDERLLMYSFVNDKFMPPDDPLGRHGPSLDNFLRKRPIMPEQKKQPCPYGKKCTYGHKCKYYHPERSAQPQRAVADELRASARTCAPAKSQHGDPGLVKSHSVPAGILEAKKGAPKRQSDPSIRAFSYSDAEEKLLLARGRGEAGKGGLCTGVGIGGGVGGRVLTMSPAPGGPPQDQPSRAATPHGLLPGPALDLYPHCESPDLSYYSMTRSYAGLALSSRRSPDCRFPGDPDLRLGSAGSECGSESSVSCGSSCDSVYGERPCPASFPPDPPPPPPPEDAPLYGAHHAGRLYAHHPSDYPVPASLHHGYHPGRGPGCGHEPPLPPPLPPPPPPDAAPPKRPLYPLPPHLQHQPLTARSSCPGDYHTLPQSSPHPPGSPLGRCLAPTRTESASDSRLYEHLSALHPHHHHHHHHHRPPPPPLPRQKPPSGWESYYRHAPAPPPASRYEPSAYQSLPDTRQSSWHAATWGQDGYAHHHHHHSHPGLHSSPTHYLNPPPPSHSPRPPHLSGSAPPLYPPPPLPPPPPPPSHAGPSPYAPHCPESPGHGSRHDDAREKAYFNLCNIFPPDLVRRAMGRNPHVSDPQQLAAAILAEKAQTGY